MILGKAQEIGRFLFGMNLTATIGAFSVDKLARRPERFARGTVKPLVFRLVNIALVIKLFKNLLKLFSIFMFVDYKSNIS